MVDDVLKQHSASCSSILRRGKFALLEHRGVSAISDPRIALNFEAYSADVLLLRIRIVRRGRNKPDGAFPPSSSTFRVSLSVPGLGEVSRGLRDPVCRG